MEILVLFHMVDNDVAAYNEFGEQHAKCKLIELYDTNEGDPDGVQRAEANLMLCMEHTIGVVYINLNPDATSTTAPDEPE